MISYNVNDGPTVAFNLGDFYFIISKGTQQSVLFL
jgi:hypothetical protein